MTNNLSIEELKSQQKAICQKYDSEVVHPDLNLKIGLALESIGQMPITGVRSKPSSDTEGWYIWAGDYSDSPDFFKPVHGMHLADILPEALPFLALAPGFKFIIDNEGYEDVWFDASLLTSE